MLIHSVAPMHLLVPQAEMTAREYRQVGNTYLEGENTPDGFRVSRIHSTDPAMYLGGGQCPQTNAAASGRRQTRA